MQECRLYRGGVGSLQYLSVHRCEVQFETSACVKGDEATDKSFVDTTWRGPSHALLRVWSDSGWAGNVKGKKSQSSMKIEVAGCHLWSASRMQKAPAHSSGEAEYYDAASATSETMLIREVLLSMELEVRTEHFLDSAAARGICRCEGVGTVRHLSSTVLRLQQLVKRGVVVLGACTHPKGTAQTWGRSHYPSTDCDSRGNGTPWCWT